MEKKRRLWNRWTTVFLVLCLLSALLASYAGVMAAQPLNALDVQRTFDVYYEHEPYQDAWEGYGDAYFNRRIEGRDCSEASLIMAVGIGVGAENYDGRGVTIEEGWNSKYNPLISVGEIETVLDGRQQEKRMFRGCYVDTILDVGFIYKTVEQDEYDRIAAWQEETGIRVLYPLLNKENTTDDQDANLWYKNKKYLPYYTNASGELEKQELAAGMILEDNYKRDESGALVYWAYYGSGTLETAQRRIRVLYYNYYQYLNGFEPTIFDTYGEYNGEELAYYKTVCIYAGGAAVVFAALVAVSIVVAKKKRNQEAKEETLVCQCEGECNEENVCIACGLPKQTQKPKSKKWLWWLTVPVVVAVVAVAVLLIPTEEEKAQAVAKEYVNAMVTGDNRVGREYETDEYQFKPWEIDAELCELEVHDSMRLPIGANGHHLNHFKMNEIEELYLVHLDAEIEEERLDDSYDYMFRVYVAKVDGQWYVYSVDYGYERAYLQAYYAEQ